jgi:hypothetical protein
MTDAQQAVPGDRRPEWDDGQPQPQRGVDAAPRPAVLPLNPWLTTLIITWIALLAVAAICAITSASMSSKGWDGNGTNPAEVASALLAIANAAFLAAIPVFAVWVAVKAVLWKAPAAQ